MQELFNLTYKDEVEKLKDEDNFEEIGDKKYIEHEDFEARLYWAFCRPSGSHERQIQDPHPLVSIMAFNHSRLGALKRFKLLHPDVVKDEELKKKIRNRARMLFRDMVDNDFSELNKVLELYPVYIDVAIDQLKNGRKWNEISADEIEATIFLKYCTAYIDNELLDALYLKLKDFEEFDIKELKLFLEDILQKKDCISKIILDYYNKQTLIWLEFCDAHILQKKSLQKLADSLGDKI